MWDYKGDASGNHAPNGSIRLQFYGYAPSGQMSWTYRAAGGDQSGRNSQLDNNQGDAYYYYADGSLDTFWDNITVQGNNWPAQQSPTADARVDFSTVSTCAGPAPTDAHANLFDQAGNRDSRQNQRYPYYYAPEGENRYTGMGYDANGNTTSPNDGWTYGYNAENQLTSASGPGGQVMLYGYDGLGRMWGDNVGGVARVYYHAGSQRIEEYNESTQASVCQYYFDAPGSDAIFLRVNQAYASQRTGFLWYLYDAQGNTTHLCDGGGNTLEQYLYDAHGKPTVYDAAGNVRSGGSAYDNRYLFRGAGAYEWYAAASLYYARARFYQPQHGRWLQPDPIGQAGGLNLYAYCGNDPVNGSDPSGKYTVINYYGSGNFPHISIGTTSSTTLLNTSSQGITNNFHTWGFYPSKPYIVGQGVLVQDSSKGLTGQIVLNTTPAQEKMINDLAKTWDTSPPTYDPSGAIGCNCESFVSAALSAAGLEVSPVGTGRPGKFFDQIKLDLPTLIVPHPLVPTPVQTNYPGIKYAVNSINLSGILVSPIDGRLGGLSNGIVIMHDFPTDLSEGNNASFFNAYIGNPTSNAILNGGTNLSNSVGIDIFTRGWGGGGSVSNPWIGGGTAGLMRDN